MTFTGEKIVGGEKENIHADYDKIPVYVRNSAIVPIAKPVQCVKSDTVFELDVHTYGGGEGSFNLYEDDFETYSYEEDQVTFKLRLYNKQLQGDEELNMVSHKYKIFTRTSIE